MSEIRNTELIRALLDGRIVQVMHHGAWQDMTPTEAISRVAQAYPEEDDRYRIKPEAAVEPYLVHEVYVAVFDPQIPTISGVGGYEWRYELENAQVKYNAMCESEHHDGDRLALLAIKVVPPIPDKDMAAMDKYIEQFEAVVALEPESLNNPLIGVLELREPTAELPASDSDDADHGHVFQVSITVRADNRRLADEMLQTELEAMLLAEGTKVESFLIQPDTPPAKDLIVNSYQHTLNRIKGLALDTFVKVHLMGGGTVEGKVGETSYDDVLVLATSEQIDADHEQITYCEIHAANIVTVEDRMVVKGS